MKAMLVIDMPDNLKNHLDKVKVDVIGTLNGQELFHRLNQPLKLMPEKKSVELACQKEEAGNDYCAGLIIGWNDCLKEIENE